MVETSQSILESPQTDQSIEATKKMDILMVFHAAPNAPPLDLGPSKRNFPFFAENLKRHRVTVLSLGSREEELRFRKEYGDRCETAVFINNRRPKFVRLLQRLWYLIRGYSQTRSIVYYRKMQRALDELVAKRHFDVIHCSSVILGYYKLPRNIPSIGDTHNVEFDLVNRAYQETKDPMMKVYWYFERTRLKREELKNCHSFDAILSTTDRDARIWKREIPEIDVTVIQNGVDRQFLTPVMNADPEPDSIIFVGLMQYYPNRHGILYFIKRVFPLILRKKPNARLYVVGAKPTSDVLACASDNIIVTGYVEDIRPYVTKCKVFVIPLLIGGGIRGKALEAMAMKKPIVSTSVGVEGIMLTGNESVLLADTPEDFAEAVVRILDDPALGKKLAEKAFETVLESYNWTAKGAELTEAYERVIRNRSGK